VHDLFVRRYDLGKSKYGFPHIGWHCVKAGIQGQWEELYLCLNCGTSIKEPVPRACPTCRWSERD
jgi:hypothetical protein